MNFTFRHNLTGIVICAICVAATFTGACAHSSGAADSRPASSVVLTGLGHDVRWADEEADKRRIDSIMSLPEVVATPATPGMLAARIGRAFLGTPYAPSTLEGESEALTVNTGGVDCTTYVELVAAMARAAREAQPAAPALPAWPSVTAHLRDLRYRGGNIDGYPSRLHYITEWIIDNAYRVNLVEVTSDLPGAKRVTKTLDFMTTHRDLYPALADSAAFDRMKRVEDGLRGSSYWVIPKSLAGSKRLADELREGDIIFITTSTPGLDVVHAGIAVKDPKGEVHLMHASSAAGKVIVDPLPLSRYLARNKTQDGIRVVRLR